MGQSCWQSWAFLTSLASFANSFGPGYWQSWAPLKHAPTLPIALAHAIVQRICQQHGPMLLANQAVGKAVVPFANSRRFPVGEGNGSRADGVPPSPTVHVAVGEAFPTGPTFLLARSSFPSLKTLTVLHQQELGNPVGKAFANRVGVFAKARVSCCDELQHKWCWGIRNRAFYIQNREIVIVKRDRHS
jgi:hypothetical protein